MFSFLKCYIVQTKHDENGVSHQETQYDIDDSIRKHSVMVQCDSVKMCDKGVQCDMITEQLSVSQEIEKSNNIRRLVFLRDKALNDIPFYVFEEKGEKYIVVKGEQVFLRHIKGHFKYDQPWNFRPLKI